MTLTAPTMPIDPPSHAPQPAAPAPEAGHADGTTLARELQELADATDRWRRRNEYYWAQKLEYLRFIIPFGESILFFGCDDGAMLDGLSPARGVGVARSSQMAALASSRYPRHEFHDEQDFGSRRNERFEYIVLNDVAGQIDDLFVFLQRLAEYCTRRTRIIIVQHNYLWRPVFRVAERLRMKRPSGSMNWLSRGDLETFLTGAGFEPIDARAKLHCPKRLLGIGPVLNAVGGVLPFASRLASTEFLVARPAPDGSDASRRTATIVLTTRDERDNIEPIVRIIPNVGAETEILFVEGHSTDGTREEIERVMEAFPERTIRLLDQPGIGQGDAIQTGFSQARGDVIILLEADQTSPPADVRKAFDIVATGRAEFVNGSRFVYPRDKGSMPLLNAIGNWVFACWFTWFLGQRTSDVLCGIKAIDKRQFDRLKRNWGFLGVHDPFGDFELAFGAARLGLKICEVPTRYGCRLYGQPKSRVVKHGSMLLRMALRATVVFKCR